MKVIKCACVRGITVHYAIVSLREANKCFCETNKVKAKYYSLLALPFHVKIYNSKLCQVKIFKINPFIRAAHERLRGTLQISECVMPKVSFHVLESISREFMSGLKGKQRRLLDAWCG